MKLLNFNNFLMGGVTLAAAGCLLSASAGTASAEVSDKFRFELNGVISAINDDSNLGGYAPDPDGDGEALTYWNNYTRLQLQYFQDKNTMFQARLHSDYESFGADYSKTGTQGTYFDQAFLRIKDPKANVTYILGKKGAYLGQGMVFNSSGNLTGAQVSLGNWYDPECLQLIAGNRKDGSRLYAANYTKNITKNWQLSLTGLLHENKKFDNKYYFNVYGDNVSYKNGIASYDGTGADANRIDYNRNMRRVLSVGTKYKAKDFTVVGEYAHNFSDEVRNGRTIVTNASKGYANSYPDRSENARNAWYVGIYTGPTNDMTSGLPLEKPGTSVWELKYQDIGANAVDAHNATFYDDAKGFRLTYGHTFKPGLSGDISIARMKDKGGNDYLDDHNGEWKTLVVAEVAYKFR